MNPRLSTSAMTLRSLLVAVVVWAACAVPTWAQELTPRAYWPAPRSTQVLIVGYQYQSGDILTDPSLPVTGVDSRINYLQAAYLYNFALAGRTANVQVSLPYSWSTTEGLLEGEFRRRSISGLTDSRARLSVNLLGAPAMDVAAFQELRAQPRLLVGTSLQVSVPSGDYETDKLINLGTNRWGVKPAFGLIYPIHPKWLVELELGVWVFSDNDEFLGTTRAQEPILSSEFHLIRRVRQGFWLSLDLNYYTGGQTEVGGELREDLQRNSRAGLTFVYPLRPGHSLKGSWSTGVVTRSGGDFASWGLSYLFAWR